ncbi:DUF4190 domain-containing protein [Leucobacter sp. M11]|uniref:DUF4190 domain-containing protein n=1 Tax=Leucobacter sp. M11 TaxID=2993565 RepID=UPI002D7E8DFC|nr:DUF4190 domain-containing protein [Leucobacter sp. M11]MEB4614428.1 DUF4190 domain-containing protein [Leucobacter sp. M11]
MPEQNTAGTRGPNSSESAASGADARPEGQPYAQADAQAPGAGQAPGYGSAPGYGAAAGYGAAPGYGASAGYGAAPGYAQAASQRTNVLAIITMIAAFLMPVAGIITGHLSLRELRTSGEQGQGLAKAGLILSYVFTALIVIITILFVILLFWMSSITPVHGGDWHGGTSLYDS